MTAIQNIHQNRLGFYPCDYETFLKIKKLQGFYWKALHRNAEFTRWSNKIQHNRVIRKWKVNDKGQRIGCEIVGPRPEPMTYPIFTNNRFIPKGGHALNDLHILAEYKNARTPRASASEVVPLKYTIDQIDRMIEDFEAFERN